STRRALGLLVVMLASLLGLLLLPPQIWSTSPANATVAAARGQVCGPLPDMSPPPSGLLRAILSKKGGGGGASCTPFAGTRRFRKSFPAASATTILEGFRPGKGSPAR